MKKSIFIRSALVVGVIFSTAVASSVWADPANTQAQVPTTPTAVNQAVSATATTAPVSPAATQTAVVPSIPTMPTPTPKPDAPNIIPQPPSIPCNGYVLIDAQTGAILASKNMDQRMAPASLTKMMTLYLVFNALANGQIHLNDNVTISKNAWQTGGSRMFIKVGSQVPVQELIDGVVIASGNDAAVALSEYVGGNQDSFVSMMNQAAQNLGLTNTHFTDATGLPDPNHYTTPHDIGMIARAIINDYPQYYPLFGQKWITFNGIRQPNRNRLLWRDPSADGLKTGHTAAAGYCLVASAKRNGERLVAVVMGCPTDESRDDNAEALLNYGFRFFEAHKLYAAGETIKTARVWGGEKESISLGLNQDLSVVIPTGQYKNLQVSADINPALNAPITKGQNCGTVKVTLNGATIAQAPIVALEDDPKGGFWTRFSDHVALLFRGWFSSDKQT